MNISGLVSIQIFWFFTTLVLLGNTKGMQIESAKIIYDISGGGILTPDNNLTFDGIEKYYMKGHGETELNHLKLLEKVDGSIDSLEQIEKIEKYTDMKTYHVDFDKEIIVIVKNRDEIYNLSDMNQTGEEVIANHHCKVWKNSYEKVCMLGEIPLLLEKSYLGFVYRKKARVALFDLNLFDELFLLPDFPIEESAIVNDTLKTTNAQRTSTLYEKILAGKEEPKTPKKLQKFTEALVEKQKNRLPRVLDEMKKLRECLSIASTQKNANDCMDDLDANAEVSAFSSEFDIGMWTKENQSKSMQYLEEHILRLQSSAPCVKRVQSIDDLSTCMKKQ